MQAARPITLALMAMPLLAFLPLASADRPASRALDLTPEPASGAVAVDTGKLNLRSGPDLAYPALAELPRGERLTVVGRAGGWLNVVRADGQAGWVNAAYVKSVGGAAPAPGPPAASGATYAVVTAPMLNLRSGPGISFPAVAEMPKGETLIALGRSGGWVNVQRGDGQAGWANGAHLQLTTSAAAPVAASSAPVCRSGDVLAGVHHPARLRVINPCLTVTGVVTEISRSDDGDLTFRLRVDPGFEWVLSSANRTKLRGYLQVEIIPADQGRLAAPPLFSRVSVTGAYVEDTPYGWREIHPVWEITP